MTTVFLCSTVSRTHAVVIVPVEVGTTRGGFVEKNYIVPIKIPEKTDIEIIAKASATSAVSAGFEFVLEKVDQS